MSSEMSHIRTCLEGRILRIELNRPEKKNALTQAMYAGLAAAFAEADKDPRVRCVLLHGAGGCFTSGNDLKDFVNPEGFADGPAWHLLKTISSLEKPVVAAVHGLAIGLGTTILLHCDLVYAAEKTRFQMPFVDLGLVPEAGASYLLPRLVGPQRAAEMILLAEPFDAHQAVEDGLANRAVAQADLLELARQKAAELAAKPPAAIRLSKAMLKSQQAASLQEAMAMEARRFGESLNSPEAKEAFAAFFEKRPADFSSFE